MTTCEPIRPLPQDALPDSPLLLPKTFSEQFERMLFIVNENVRLWESWKYRNEEMLSIVKETKHMCEVAHVKNRTCERCPKLMRELEASVKKRVCERCPELERRVKNQESLISDLVKAVSKDHDSYEVLSQQVTRLKKEPVKPPLLETDANKEDSDSSVVMKSPDTYRRTDDREVSPIVNRSRNIKRRLKCISSKKKNKLENGESVTTDVGLDLDFPELQVVSYHSKSRAETPDVIDTKDFALPLEKIEELDNTVAEEPSLNGIGDMIEPTQKMTKRPTRRSLTFNPGKPNLNDVAVAPVPEEHSKEAKSSAEKTKSTSPLNVIITSNKPDTTSNYVFKSPDKNVKLHLENLEKMRQKTKWNLTRSREPTAAKLKQTLLSTAALEKKTDISTLEKFNGGSMLAAVVTKNNNDEANSPTKKLFDNKENSVEPTFDSAITSTANDMVMKTPVKVENRYAKYTRNVVDNSFDVIPKTSPNYKYKRDAVRKKSDRRKLPGQDCDACAGFYDKQKEVVGETQARRMIEKCSRHRDKFPIKSNTPPGFWNPVFDTEE